MKKLLLLFALSIIPASSFAQSLLVERNKTFDINIGYVSCGAVAGTNRNDIYGISGIQCSLSGWGVYVDIATNTEGSHSGNMGIDKYDGYYALSWHVGYALPLCNWFKVIPHIGMQTWLKGYYDGSDWYVNEGTIVNEFKDARGDYRKFDYGATLQFTAFKHLNIYVNVTSYNVGAGIGFSVPTNAFR